MRMVGYSTPVLQVDIKVDEDLGLPVIIPVGKARQGEGGQEKKNQVRLCRLC